MVKSPLLGLLAIGLGLAAGYVDMHNDEVQATVLVVLVSTFALGLAQPRHAWRWALLVGPGVFLMYVLAGVFGFAPRAPAEPGPWATLIALIPALFGTYAGAGVRLVLSQILGGNSSPQG